MIEGWWMLAGLIIVAWLVVIFPIRHSKVMCFSITPIFFVLVLGCYWKWGAWPLLHQFETKRMRQVEAQKLLRNTTSQDVIAKMKAHLSQKPSAQGFFLLGRLYMSQQRWQEATDALAKAHQLKPNSVKITINYVESSWELHHHVMSDEMRAKLQALFVLHPNQPDALAMLALDAFQAHDYRRAIDYWERLLSVLPPQSIDSEMIRKAIAKATEAMEKHDEGKGIPSD